MPETSETKNQNVKKEGLNIGVAIALGAAFGLIVNNIALGAGLGLVIWAIFSSKNS